jgi:hypothetical protein
MANPGRVGARNSVTSCNLGVFVEEPAEPVASDDLHVRVDGIGERPERTGLFQCPMRPVPIEMELVLAEGLLAVIGIWLWHKDREAVTDSYGVLGDLVIAIP